jgi:acyl-CoA reductase-like NAD-dependent aldehyde dehydrogenase
MRLEIVKTYKLYIGGQFPRTESGRFYTPLDKKGNQLGNMCLASRKDVKNSVTAARKAFGTWSEKTAFNRSQVLYRIAEMLEGRRDQFISELIKQGSTNKKAEEEVNLSIDRIVYYAGWCDKYSPIFSSVNPVSSSHFNFSVQEPVGVVGVIAPEDSSLIGLVSTILPIIAGGNTCLVLASEKLPLCAITFAEVLNSSDVPGGVINILTGTQKELIETFATHMDINSVLYSGGINENLKLIQELSVVNVKRVYSYNYNWTDENEGQSVYIINDFQEIKTTWHPIENIGGTSSNY